MVQEPTRRLCLAAAIAALGLVVMVAVAASEGPARLVAGDGHYVFAAGRSLAYDGDLDLTNQYLRMGDRWGLGRDPAADGWRLPARELGASLLMVPGLLLHWLLGAPAPLEPVFACLGAALSLGPCWLGCVRAIDAAGLDLTPREVEGLAAAALFGFVVPYYAVGSPGYAHALDATIGAWLVAALLGHARPGWVGALLAAAVATRLQNSLWLAWPAAAAAQAIRGGSRASAELVRVATIAAIGAIGIAPQLVLGLLHPGSVRGAWGWTLGFFDLHDYGRDLLRVLGGVHGLVRYTPIAALALVGLVGLGRRSWPAWAVLLGLWLLLASVRDVDAGDAFGARRLAGIVGLLAVGLASLFARAKAQRWVHRASTAAIALLVVVNLTCTGLAVAGRLSLATPPPALGQDGGPTRGWR